eukprot:s276_g12.t1
MGLAHARHAAGDSERDGTDLPERKLLEGARDRRSAKSVKRSTSSERCDGGRRQTAVVPPHPPDEWNLLIRQMSATRGADHRRRGSDRYDGGGRGSVDAKDAWKPSTRFQKHRRGAIVRSDVTVEEAKQLQADGRDPWRCWVAVLFQWKNQWKNRWKN